MKHLAILAAGALAVQPMIAAAQPAQSAMPELNLEQHLLLRCSAAFGIIAGEQARGVKSAQSYPPLAERGKEFFVRASAQLMDELQLSREQVTALVQQEVSDLQRLASESGDPPGFVDGVMQPCLAALDASGI